MSKSGSGFGGLRDTPPRKRRFRSVPPRVAIANMSDILTVEENSEIDDPTINSHTETLNRHLGGLNLEIDAIQPDGDCAFRSV